MNPICVLRALLVLASLVALPSRVLRVCGAVAQQGSTRTIELIPFDN